MKRVAIVQSNYIPWKGYFDMIAAVDEFILYDDMQYTRRDWRNRNKIKTPQGSQWITVPVLVKGKYHQKIHETQIDGMDWAAAHWKSIDLNYRRAPHFEDIANWVQPLYLSSSYEWLSELNRRFIEEICGYLGINTVISTSRDYDLIDGKTERLADLSVKAGATEYVSGPAAKDYVEADVFDQYGVKLSWFDYDGYPQYPQQWGDFDHAVTILDLLMNCGKEAPKYMRCVL
ncbi:WbqC family protein [Roseobacter sp. YSTF-M11]|uniref:WbqC family protein n=1 Tax=Roseobacter insulae TaxID=2859783 RepID=A0A9X1G074_9RHOB|nr:WbqC family protein [Roseobacter insulae]MBW4710816.1 WbqC family protein [Roseobacter insulae]